MGIKWRNRGLWVAIGSLVAMILNDALGIAPNQVQPYIDVILSVAIAAGIVSNPSIGKGFSDKDGE